MSVAASARTTTTTTTTTTVQRLQQKQSQSHNDVSAAQHVPLAYHRSVQEQPQNCTAGDECRHERDPNVEKDVGSTSSSDGDNVFLEENGSGGNEAEAEAEAEAPTMAPTATSTAISTTTSTAASATPRPTAGPSSSSSSSSSSVCMPNEQGHVGIVPDTATSSSNVQGTRLAYHYQLEYRSREQDTGAAAAIDESTPPQDNGPLLVRSVLLPRMERRISQHALGPALLSECRLDTTGDTMTTSSLGVVSGPGTRQRRRRLSPQTTTRILGIGTEPPDVVLEDAPCRGTPPTDRTTNCVVVAGAATLFSTAPVSSLQLQLAQDFLRTTMSVTPTQDEQLLYTDDSIVGIQYREDLMNSNNDNGESSSSGDGTNKNVIWGSILIAFGVCAVLLVGLLLRSRRRRRQQRRTGGGNRRHVPLSLTVWPHPPVWGIQSRESFDDDISPLERSLELGDPALNTSWENLWNSCNQEETQDDELVLMGIPPRTLLEQKQQQASGKNTSWMMGALDRPSQALNNGKDREYSSEEFVDDGPPKSITTTTLCSDSWGGSLPDSQMVLLAMDETFGDGCSSISSTSLYVQDDLSSDSTHNDDSRHEQENVAEPKEGTEQPIPEPNVSEHASPSDRGSRHPPEKASIEIGIV